MPIFNMTRIFGRAIFYLVDFQGSRLLETRKQRFSFRPTIEKVIFCAFWNLAKVCKRCLTLLSYDSFMCDYEGLRATGCEYANSSRLKSITPVCAGKRLLEWLVGKCESCDGTLLVNTSAVTPNCFLQITIHQLVRENISVI